MSNIRNTDQAEPFSLPNLTENAPFEYMISRAPSLAYHTAIKDRSEILLQAYTSLLCGGSFLFIDAIDPDGGLNEELYKMMGEIKRELVARFTMPNFVPTLSSSAKGI